MSKELTPKQVRFCEEYIFDFNGTRSYKVAYKATSDNIAAVEAHKLLRKPNVAAYIEEIQKDLSKISGVSKLRNIEELKKIAYSSLQNYHSNWMTLEDWDNVSDRDKAAISEMTHTTMGSGDNLKTIVKFKLYDKLSAIDSLNKMLGHNSAEKVDLTSKGESLNLTGSEREERIKMLLAKAGK